MHAIVYRWRVRDGREDAFAAAWARMTDTIRAGCGSFGSRLHRAEDGTWVAYALWPARAPWEACTPDNPAAAAAMGEAIEEAFDPLHLTILDDRLAPIPAG